MRNRLIRSLKKRWRVLSDAEFRAFRRLIRRFNREQGRGTPTRFEGVDARSVVFDLGGYEGEWASDMRAQYDCTVHVFEPHPGFARALARRFADDPKVVCHDYALGAGDGELVLSDSADASSAFVDDGPSVTGKIRAADKVLADLDVGTIAATKINIEGGEYDILPFLIETGLIAKFAAIAIQFHNYAPGDTAARNAIRAGLAKTHRCVWNYDFVWEQWERKAKGATGA